MQLSKLITLLILRYGSELVILRFKIIKRENAAIIQDSDESPQIARLYLNSWLQLFAD